MDVLMEMEHALRKGGANARTFDSQLPVVILLMEADEHIEAINLRANGRGYMGNNFTAFVE